MITSPIEEVKNRLDIVEVIGSYIKLQKVGANYRAPCPFHSEKKPSFFVSPARQTWHCFGACGIGGDVFKFVMKIEGIEFGDALRLLAQKAGVELRRQDPKIRTERQRLYEICELAGLFFQRQLESKTGQEAKKYLLDRGINESSIEEWRLGYAPDNWESLSNFLISKNYTREEIIKAGLAVRKQEKGSYDRFRGRIMFPIFDLNSQVVGFTGRIFGKKEDVAKYVNTPNTLLYDKSRILYGLNRAKMAIRNKNACILVEGQTDVVMSHQIGIENVVATSGTALTPYQLVILKRYSENLITAFDMDIAGDSATKKGIDLAQSQGFNIKVVVMPEGKDPADITAQNPEEWKKLTGATKSILDFYFETTFGRHDAETPEGKKEISKILLPIIKIIPNKIEQSHWTQKLAEKLKVKEEDVEIEMKKIKQKGVVDIYSKEDPQAKEKKSRTKKEILEERIIFLILKNPKAISLIKQEYFPFFTSQTQEILLSLKKDPDFFKKTCDNQELSDYLDQLCFITEMESKDADLEQEINICLLEVQTIKVKEELDNISKKIKLKEKEKDVEKVNLLTKEFHKLSKQLNDNKKEPKK